MKNAARCHNCVSPPALDLGAALHELGTLNKPCDPPTPGLSERRLRTAGTYFEQSPPPWINSPTMEPPTFFGLPIGIEIEQAKDLPLQPPNSPVSPKLPFEHFRSRW